MKRYWLIALGVLFGALGWLSQPYIVDAQGTLTVVESVESGSGDQTGTYTSESAPFRRAYVDIVVNLNVTTITTADGDDEVDFFVQTTYDNGTTWCDLESKHFDNGDNGGTATLKAFLGPWPPVSSATKMAACTDAALADDTKNAWPVGDRIRVKSTVTGATAPTYAYNASVSFGR